MASVTIRVAEVNGTQRRQEDFARTNSGVIQHEQGTRKTTLERHGHEGWKQLIEETWLGQLESLQQYVCELLQKNEQLRMALMAANERGRLHRDARN